MGFAIPEYGTEEWVDLMCRLEQARYENAKRWTVVLVDEHSGDICQTIGPFTEAEQALVHAGEHDRDWRETEDPEGNAGFVYKIVPLWGPGE